MLIHIKKHDIRYLIMSLLVQNYKVVGTKKKGQQYIFDKIKRFEEFTIEYLPTLLPIKKFLIPHKELLFHYDKTDGEYHEPADMRCNTVYLGLRFCDLESVRILDDMLLSGKKDVYYEARRMKSLFFVFDCLKLLDEYCFCDMVFEKDDTIADAVFYEDENSYLVHVKSDAAKSIFSQIRQYWIPVQTSGRKPAHFNMERLIDKKENMMDENRLLTVCTMEAQRCFECGSCFMVCPTCICFSIEDKDDLNMQAGQRKRVWDGCMLKDFSLVAGGHRLVANGVERTMHRFKRKYINALKNQGRFLCVGCGRCSRACPAGNDTLRILREL